VIHTANPTNGDAGEIYVELVRGLGEAIVSGTVPGAALTFVARKDDIENPKVGRRAGQGNRGRGLCWQRVVVSAEGCVQAWAGWRHGLPASSGGVLIGYS
jgi:hypothetical protein